MKIKCLLKEKRFPMAILSIVLVICLCISLAIIPGAYSDTDNENASKSTTENVDNLKSESKPDDLTKKSYIIKTKTETTADMLISRDSNNSKRIGSDKRMISSQLSEEQVKELSDNSDILYVEEDYIVTACNDDLPEAESDYEWNIETVGADELQQMGYTGNGIKVAVIDSGIDKWLVGNTNKSIDFVAENGESDIDDLTGHGTAVSSIISAPFDNFNCTGIAPDVLLYSLKVLDGQNSSPISRVIEGIDWCIENDIDVINLSFGTGNYSIALNEIIQEAVQNGITVVAAAGNNGITGGIQYPAKYDNVIAVAAIGADMQRSEFSAVGEELTISAPGDQIRAAGLFGGESIVSGTSFAAAHVTGAVALLLERMPNATPEFIYALIRAGAISLGAENEYGSGLIDLSYTLEICDEFYENYNNSNWEPSSNTNIAEDVSDEVNYVNGLWGGSNHDIVINGLPNSTSKDIAFVKAVARLMDDDPSFQGKNFPQVHAHPGQNYVTTARFLYHVIRYYWGLSTNNVMVSKPAYMGSEWTSIVTDLNTLFGKTVNGRTGNTNSNKGWMAMGALGHLIGDIYAHAAIVSPSLVNSFNSSHFITAVSPGTDIYHPTTNNIKNDNRIMYEHLHTNLYHFVANSYTNLQIPYQCRCFNCFKRAVSLGVVTTLKIQTFYNGSTTGGGSLYEDNANFMPARLTKAASYFTHLTTELMANHAFPMRAMSTGDFKLERFVEYSCCNGENVASVRSWSDLSTQLNRSNNVCNNSSCNMHSGSNTCLCKAHKTAIPGTQTPNPLAADNFEHYVNSSFPNCSYTP